MDKCWFVLEESFYIAPVYASADKAGGKTTAGNLRLGDAVPRPTTLYPVLTHGDLPAFPSDMAITSSTLCHFSWKSESSRQNEGSAGVDVPAAAAVGVTASATLSAKFQSTMKSWANFDRLETEVVQPSRDYIDSVLAMPEVQAHVKPLVLPLPAKPIYIVIGLMIARAGGTVGHSESDEHKPGADVNINVPSIVKGSIHGDHDKTGTGSSSGDIEGDRIWAVRFAKVDKGFLQRQWTQTEVVVGAMMARRSPVEEKVPEVLEHEGVASCQVSAMQPTSDDEDALSFVTGWDTNPTTTE